MILPKAFYTREDVLLIAKELLGKVLVSNIDGRYTAGMIVETEAYAGIGDKASHAYGGRRTNRTEQMYAQGGTTYVYLCYGIHHLFNVVTNKKNVPHAVLIRGVEPLDGIETMLQRRGMDKLRYNITAGPGTLSSALGINTSFSGHSLLGGTLYIEDRGIRIDSSHIIESTRIGVAYAKEDALLPYRFYIKDNKYVSKGKGT